jgi:hypothetical protein
MGTAQPESDGPSRIASTRRSRLPAGVRPEAIGLAVIVAIAAMAGVLVYFGALFSGPSTGQPGPCGLACGAIFAISSPTPGRNGTARTYSMAITPSSGATVANLSFDVQNANGTPLSLPQAYVQVLGPSGCLVGSFAFSTHGWSNGPMSAPNACTPPGTTQSLLTSGMRLVLSTGSSDLRGQGDQFVATVSGVGNVYTELP